MKKYELLLFDLDGTLTYSHEGIYNCIRYALQRLGKSEPSETVLRSFVGPPLYKSFHETLFLSEEESEKAVEYYRERYKTVGLFENEPLPHAIELLKSVKAAGYKTALATAKPKIFADRIAERFGFAPYLDYSAVATTDKSCGKAWVVGELLRLSGVSKENALMIGDRDDDVLGAREHGVACAAVTCGYALEGEFERAKPAFVFNNLKELERFLV